MLELWEQVFLYTDVPASCISLVLRNAIEEEGPFRNSGETTDGRPSRKRRGPGDVLLADDGLNVSETTDEQLMNQGFSEPREPRSSPRNVRQRGYTSPHSSFGSTNTLWTWNNNAAPRSSRPIASSSLPTPSLHPSLGFSRFASSGGGNVGFTPIPHPQLEGVNLTNLTMNMNMSTNDGFVANIAPSNLQNGSNSNFGVAYSGDLQVANCSNADVNRQLQHVASCFPYINLMEGYNERVAEFVNNFEATRHRSSLTAVANYTLEMENASGAGPSETAQDSSAQSVEDSEASYESEDDEEIFTIEEEAEEVTSGLSEEAIMAHLRQRRYGAVEVEHCFDCRLCCICQEEYAEGEELGKLDCGHDFHIECIGRWLERKNSCPICKQITIATADFDSL